MLKIGEFSKLSTITIKMLRHLLCMNIKIANADIEIKTALTLAGGPEGN